MSNPPPRIDSRDAAQIAQDVRSRLAQTFPDWQEGQNPTTRQPQGLSTALVAIFARYGEIVIQRLNQVPQKNFLAFLNLLGGSQLPPQPARVPLSFFLAAGSPVDGLVPVGTQVAAPPTEGETDAVIFETERELVVTAAKLESVYVRNPESDRVGDHSVIVATNAHSAVFAFEGDQSIEHHFYLGNDAMLSYTNLKALRLTLTLILPAIPNNGPRDAWQVAWEYWDGQRFVQLVPTADTTQNLRQSGNVIFGNSTSNLPEFKSYIVDRIEKRWLRCRLITPINTTPNPRSNTVRSTHLPQINAIQLQPTLQESNLPLDAAFTNQIPIDLSKDFFPFGEQPKIGDACFLASQAVFAKTRAAVTLNVTVTPPDEASGLKKSAASANLELTWEYWNGQAWIAFGISTIAREQPDLNRDNAFTDTTKAFTETGAIQFMLPTDANPMAVNGIDNHWIRVRISQGNYGIDGKYIPKTIKVGETTLETFTFEPPRFTPPLIQKILASYTIAPIDPPSQPPAESHPEALLSRNDGTDTRILAVGSGNRPFSPFHPFQPTAVTVPTLYLGLTLPSGRSRFPNRPLTIFCRTADVRYGAFPVTSPPPPSLPKPPQLQWSYWNGQTWANLTVQDESENLTRTGLIAFLPPADLALKPADQLEFGLNDRYWIRVQWQSGQYKIAPKLQNLLLNTTTATQTVTRQNEILGSSDGSQNQRFQTTQAPVLAAPFAPQLEVRELELPSEAERAAIQSAEGADSITEVRPSNGQPQEIWIRWHEVMDFYGSRPRDRHYVLDHLTGAILFGNGINGLIPPLEIGNIRMRRYATGGGESGNRAVGTIVQLKTTVPYVDRVINPEPATGGAAAEALASLIDRAPRTIRHGNRAVTPADYEDLAMLAAPSVARAKCVPLRNLSQAADPGNPQVTTTAQRTQGDVSVIIVPQSNDRKPLPSVELIQRVEDYLGAHAPVNAAITVVGAEYIRVSVTVEVSLMALEGASAIEQLIDQTLTRFLHPLTGGFDGQGWPFGRKPHKSDFYALIESIPGVDHVNSLIVDPDRAAPSPPIQAILQTDRFLVYSGIHNVTLRFEHI